MSEPVIQLDDFRKTYRTGEIEVHAVRGVNMKAFAAHRVEPLVLAIVVRKAAGDDADSIARQPPAEARCIVVGTAVEAGAVAGKSAVNLRAFEQDVMQFGGKAPRVLFAQQPQAALFVT